MASATPPNKPVNGRPRVPVAIPLHYPNHRRANSKAVPHEATPPAKSEKSDTGNGDEKLALHGVQHPMTPESLPSSVHRPTESLDEELKVSEVVVEDNNGSNDDTVPMPPLEPQTTIRADSAHDPVDPDAVAGAPRTNGVRHINGSKENNIKGKPRSNSKPLRILQAPPPEFHPSEPSSTPLSPNSSHMGHSFSYPTSAPAQSNGYNVYAPQMLPHPAPVMAFNPEAHFQPIDHVATHMSRTSSHTSSVGRAGELQSPVVQNPPSALLEMRYQASMALQDHMFSQFDRAQYSDLTIVFHAETARRILVHTLVVSRSERLWKQISELKEPSHTIHVQPPNPSMTEIGLMAALRYLYGAPLWIPQNIFFELGQLVPEFAHGAAPAHVMSHVLSYIASGHYLGLPEVVQAGLICARGLQTWDTVVMCLVFALDGGLDQRIWRMSSEPETHQTDVLKGPIYGQASTQLLQDTLYWIAMAFPAEFRFAPSATQLAELPRLPTVIENRPSQADPRLSLIQFGELAPEEGRPDYLTLFLSSILLSLPSAALHFLFNQPGFRQKPLDHVQIAEAVIAEREDRRIKVLQAKRLKDGKNPALWEATRFKEEVVREPYLQLRRTFLESEPQASAGV